MAKKNCSYCFINPSVYNVVTPVCVQEAVGLKSAPLCPSCFQRGINMKEIEWIGDKPYGICADCMVKSA